MTATDVPPALPPSLLATLGGRCYTDPGVFALETERVFAAMWQCVARADELPSPGRFVTVPVAGESVLLVRGRDGALRAFYNVCRHRGARLCTEDSGEVRRVLRCTYHAWTYGLDGALVAAPHLATMPDVDRERYGLAPVHLREWLGYVWVCLAAEPEPFEVAVQSQVVDRLGDLAPLDAYAVQRLAVGRRVTYDVAANWKLVVENFMECYHCSTIHPELTDMLPEFRQGFAAQYFVGHGADFAPDVAGFTVDGRAGFDRLPGLADEQDRRYYAVTIRPQVFLNLVPDHVILHRMVPLAADRTIVHCDWLYAPEVVAATAAEVSAGTAAGGTADGSGRAGDLDASVELFHRVNLQDFEACERCQLGMGSRVYADGGVLVPSEHHLAGFHDWLRDRLATPG